MVNFIKISFSIFIISILIFLAPSSVFGIIFENEITITNPTPKAMDEFGFSVAYDGKNILVGAGGDTVGSSDKGTVYLYDENGVLQMRFLNPTPTLNPGTNELFGHIVAISENNVLITARHDDTVDHFAGAAYLFDMTTCDSDLSNNGIVDDNICESPLFTLTNPERSHEVNDFGATSSISGNNVLIGTPIVKSIEKFGGGAYLYDITTGDLLQTFYNPIPFINDQFGHWVSISGNNILIGARMDDIGATDAGSAYLFDAITGDLLQTFQNPTPESGDQFGFSLAMSGNNVLIGAIGDDTGEENTYLFKTGSDAGAVYLFDAITGDLLQTFQKNIPIAGDQFGFSLAMSGNNVLIGAIGDDTGADDAGAVYLFLENVNGTCEDGTELIDGICRVIKTEEPKGVGSCLIATAAYGTELSPQVQFLREIRDNTVMSTSSGIAFMSGFNQLYYSFSPTIADMERENPMFQEIVRVFITPMISSLSIMTLAEEGSEVEVLGLGISVIALNLGMYIAVPAFVINKIRKWI